MARDEHVAFRAFPAQLAALAARWPDRPALTVLPEGEAAAPSLSFGELATRTGRAAAQLSDRARPGAHCVLAYAPGAAFAEAFLGCLWAGLVPIVVAGGTGRRPATRLGAVLSDTVPALFLTDGVPVPMGAGPWIDTRGWSAAGAGRGPVAASPEAPAFVQYTSGSTGRPRGAVISHGALAAELSAYGRRHAGDWGAMRFLSWLPHWHDFGLVGFWLAALSQGAEHVVMPPRAFLQRPARWMRAVARHRATVTGAPCFAYDLAAEAGGAGLDLRCLRHAALGGDYIQADTLARFERAFATAGFERTAWLPAYGQAEAVLAVTCRQGAHVIRFDAPALHRGRARPVAEGGVALVSCGAPDDGNTLQLVEPEDGLPCAEGRIGEIRVSGRARASGYLGEMPQAAPMAELRTGDLGFLWRGELFVTGRGADRIVVDGLSLSAEEIETSAAAADPILRRYGVAAVQTGQQSGADVAVLAEIAGPVGADLPGLAAAVCTTVAAGQGVVLAAVHLLRPGALPRGLSGKLARSECRQMLSEGRVRALYSWHRPASAAQALSATEAVLEAMIAAAMPGLRPGPEESFLALGLDSLKATELAMRAGSHFGVRLDTRDVLTHPSLRQLAARIDAAKAGPSTGPPAGSDPVLTELQAIRVLLERQVALLEASGVAPLAPKSGAVAAAKPPELPLSPEQAEMALRLEMLDRPGDLFVVQMVLAAEGTVAPGAVQRAVTSLAWRHAALRTYVEAGCQVIAEAPVIALERVALTDEAAALDWLRADRVRGFAPEVAPLWRVALLTLPTGTLVVLTGSHLILDGASMPVLAHDLGWALAGHTLSPAMAFDTALETRRLSAADRAMHRTYWAERIGAAAPDWRAPGQTAAVQVNGYEVDRRTRRLPLALRQQAQALGGRAGATLAEVCVAFAALLLRRVSRQDRLMIGLDSAGRGPGMAEVVGPLNRVVPLVFDFEAQPMADAVALVAQTAEVMRGALAHQHYRRADLAADEGRPRDPGRAFEVMAAVNYQSFPQSVAGLRPRHDLERAAVSSAPFGLSFELRDVGDAVELELVFNRELFDADWIDGLADRYLGLLEAAGAAPDSDPDLLPLIDGAEADRIAAWAEGGPELEGPGLWQTILATAAARPNAVALRDGSAETPYGALCAEAGQVARGLASLGISAGDRVALLAERSVRYWVTVLGIMARGAVYVALDPAAPGARLADQLRQAGVGLLLHDGNFGAEALCAESGLRGVGWDALPVAAGAEPVDPAAGANAYVLFTSGSTGAPKAAAVHHGGMMGHLLAKIALLGLGPEDVVAQTAPQSFDISVWQAFAALTAGGTTVVIADLDTHDPEALLRRAAAEAVTVLQVVPAVLQGALERMSHSGRWIELPRLRYLSVTGEALGADLARRWIALYPRAPLVNAYGPTECSDDVAHFVAEWPPGAGETGVPIGRPIPGARLLVRGPKGQPVPVGTPGELYVGGNCVGPGYLNDPVRMAEAFVEDADHRRLYRTGDLVRWRDDGFLEFLGRVDGQQKLNGVRFDPSEIEAAIRHDPAVARAVVQLVATPSGRRRVAAWVVLRPGREALEGTLKAVARNHLPRALVPESIVIVKAIPLTLHGKTDLAGLPPPGPERPRSPAVPPGNALERMVSEIWCAELGLKDLGIHDDFFDLGGRSIDAARIVRRLNAQSGGGLPLVQMFRAPTVAGLAAFLAKTGAAS